MQSRWFAPNRFRTQGVEGKFNGVYLSYFTFDAMTLTAYDGQRGDYYYYVTVGNGQKTTASATHAVDSGRRTLSAFF